MPSMPATPWTWPPWSPWRWTASPPPAEGRQRPGAAVVVRVVCGDCACPGRPGDATLVAPRRGGARMPGTTLDPARPHWDGAADRSSLVAAADRWLRVSGAAATAFLT